MRAEVILRLFCQFQLSFSLFWQDRRFVAERAPNADPPEKIGSESINWTALSGPPSSLLISPRQLNMMFLRLHGLIWHVDWMETLAMHPHYVTQAVCFARSPFTGRASGLLPLPMPTSRGFSNLAELPSGVMRAFLLGRGRGKGTFAAVDSVMKAKLRRPRGLAECGHAACMSQTNQPPGIDQGSIPG